MNRCARVAVMSAPTPSPSASPAAPTTAWRIKMLYDSECPLCMREVDMLRRRDAENNYISFVDIASPSYLPEDNAGISFEQAMERIHGIYPDGSFVVDIAAFKAFYELVGLGWVYKITEVGFVNKALNAVYGVWAANRLSITGRPDMDTILREKKTCRSVADR